MQTKQRLFKPTEPAYPANGDLIPLHQREQYAAKLEELQALETLHAEKERERKKHLARARGEKTKRSAMERAADLLGGGRIDPSPPEDAIRALNEELDILRVAIGTKTRELDAIASQLSFEESAKSKPEFDRAMLDALAAMERLSAAFNSAASLATRLHRAGYRASPVLLSDLFPQAVAQLGDPNIVGGNQAWYFKKALQDRGII